MKTDFSEYLLSLAGAILLIYLTYTYLLQWLAALVQQSFNQLP